MMVVVGLLAWRLPLGAHKEWHTIMMRVRFIQQAVATAALALVGSVGAPTAAFAQYMGHNFHGDFAVNSGTQPVPGFYVALPLGQWNADTIANADGEAFLPGQFEGFDLRVFPTTVIAVTPRKILGANFGAMVALPFSTIWPERTTQQVGEPEWGFSDLYVVPVYLGWHTPRADYVAGYGFYAPTGRYEAGATDNVGLGMWSQELQAGTTVYFDEGKKFSAATTAYLEMHSKKKDQDLKVGNLLTLEGGAAYNIPKIAGAFGFGYYLQQKVSDDSGANVPTALLRSLNLLGRNRLFGIGPDVTMGLFQRGQAAGLINVRYFWDTSAKSSFKGGTFWVALTLARLTPP
jgi:hypothetical protein